MNKICLALFFALISNAGLKAADSQPILSGTPLHAACYSGNLDIVQLLIAAKANVNIKDKRGNTPVLAACSSGYSHVVDLFLSEENIEKININACNAAGNSLLHLTCEKIKGEDAKKLIKKIVAHQHICLNCCNKKRETPLHIACDQNNPVAVKLLLQHRDIDIAVVDDNLYTPFDNVCFGGNEEIFKIFLRDSKVDVNAFNLNLCYAPLCISIIEKRIGIVDLLLQEEALNMYSTHENNDGKCLLDVVIEKLICFEVEADFGGISGGRIIKAFIDHQWRNLIDKYKQKFFDICVQYEGELVPLILEKQKDEKRERINQILFGEDENSDDKMQKFPNGFKEYKEVVDEMGDDVKIDHEFSVNHKDKDGLSPLHIACAKPDVKLVKVLLKHNADANTKDNTGRAPIHQACGTNNASLVKALIKHNADVNSEDRNGYRPFDYALSCVDLEATKLLMKHGADVDWLSNGACLPLDMALNMYLEMRVDDPKKEDLKGVIKHLLMSNLVYSDRFNEIEDTKNLLEEIRIKIQADSYKFID